MRTTFNQLNRWLHLWLILALVGNLLSPIAPAFASPAASNSAQLVAADKEASLSGAMNEKVAWPTSGSRTSPASLAAPRTFPLPFNPDSGSPSQDSEVTENAAKASELIQTTPPITPSGLIFIENVGQFDARARFVVRGGLGTLYLADGALWFTLLERPEPLTPTQRLQALKDPKVPRPQPKRGVNLKLHFPGANPQARLEPFNRLETHVSFLKGNDPAQWRSDVPVWGGVRYVDFYPGVDLELSGAEGAFGWRLAARGQIPANFAQSVRLQIQGAETLAVEGEAVRINTGVGQFLWPLLSLTAAAGRSITLPDTPPTLTGQTITAPFKPGTTASLPLSTPHLAAPLPLAPLSFQSPPSDLVYATYISGGDGRAIAIDGSGNAYVTGIAVSSTFSPTIGAFDLSCDTGSDCRDAFVLKVNSSGSALMYATFLGGSNVDSGNDIAVDSLGNAYITGDTSSTDFFPTTTPPIPGFDQAYGGDFDAFVVKLNATGSNLSYGSYLGGGSSEHGQGIAVDSAGSAYVTGQTGSSFFPVNVPGYNPILNPGYTGFNAYVVKLNPAGTWPEYATYLGEDDIGRDIAVDSAGNAYVTGQTGSVNFPIVNAFDPTYTGGGDAFVAKIAANGLSLAYASFLGGSSSDDYGYGIDVDGAGNAYVTGWTQDSVNFFPPSTPGFDQITSTGYWDAFVVKVAANGASLVYGNFIGGSNTEWGNDIAVDSAGNAYVTGLTESSNWFPQGVAGFDRTYNGLSDAFMVKVAPTGLSLAYATYLGGSGNEEGYGLAVDEAGHAYLTGDNSAFIPAGTPGFDTTFDPFDFGFVAKLSTGSATGPVDLQVLDPQGLPVTQLITNTNGWPTPNPLTVQMTLTNTTGATLTNPALALTLNSPYTSGAYTGRFYVLETNGFGGGVYGGSPVQYNKVVTTGQALAVSQTTVLTAQMWVQPSITTTLSITAALYADAASVGQGNPLGQDSAQVGVPKANIRPIIFIPGYLGTFPPAYGPEYGGNGKIDPLFKSYDNLIAALEQAGYEKGPAGSGATLIPFPYDWRQPLENTGSITLTNFIDKTLNPSNPRNYVNYDQVDLAVHSTGGLIARAYLENTSVVHGQTVHTLLTLGSPHQGVPGAYLGQYGGDPTPVLPKPIFNMFLSAVLRCEEGQIPAVINYYFPPEHYYDYFRNKAPSIADFIPRADYVPQAYLLANTPVGCPVPEYCYGKPPSPFLDDLNTLGGLYDVEKLQEVPRIISSYGSYYYTPVQYKVDPPPNPAPSEQPEFWKFGTVIDVITQATGDLLVPDYSGNLRELVDYPNIISHQEPRPPGVSFDPNDPSTFRPTHMGLVQRPHMIRRIISYTTGIDITQEDNFWNTEYIVPNEDEIEGAASACSPVRLLAIDPLGRRAGLDLNSGQVINEIPGAYVTEGGLDPQVIVLPKIEGQYQIQGIGVEEGTYNIGWIQGVTSPVHMTSFTGTTTAGQFYEFTSNSTLPQETGGQIVLEVEQFSYQTGPNNGTWQSQAILDGYIGSGYLSALPDIDQIFTTPYTTSNPALHYAMNFSTPGTYYVWLRGYAPNGAGDSIYLNLDDQSVTTLTGFLPRVWSWTGKRDNAQGIPVTVEVMTPGLHTLHIWQREDGLRLDQILLTSNGYYNPNESGP